MKTHDEKHFFPPALFLAAWRLIVPVSAVVLAISCAAGTPASDTTDAPMSEPGRAAPRTGKFTLMALGDNPAADIERLEHRYDLMIASEDVKDDALRAFRSRNPGAPVFCYFNTSDIDGDSPYSLYRRTWDDTNPHEDWFHHDAAGERVRIYYPKYKNRCAFDTGKPELQRYLAGRVAEILRTGRYDGIQLDNVSTEYPFYARLVGSWISAEPVNLTPAEWVDDEVAMLRVIVDTVRAAGFGTATLIFNHMRSGEPEPSRRYIEVVDGANCESWMSRRVGFDGVWGWSAKVAQVRGANGAGKLTNLLNVPGTPSEDEALFCYASYLMAFAGERAYFFYAPGYKARQQVWYPFYDIDLGAPDGERTELPGKVFSRNFTKGAVFVNPTATAVEVALPSPMKTPLGASASTVRLEPNGAAVLLKP